MGVPQTKVGTVLRVNRVWLGAMPCGRRVG